MNKINQILLRSLESLLIMINADTMKNIKYGGVVIRRITFNFAFVSVDPYASVVSINTAVFGYVLSFLVTLACYRRYKVQLFRISLVLSALGTMSFILEMIRYYSMQQFQVVIQAGVLLIVIDWLCLFRYPQEG